MTGRIVAPATPTTEPGRLAGRREEAGHAHSAAPPKSLRAGLPPRPGAGTRHAWRHRVRPRPGCGTETRHRLRPANGARIHEDRALSLRPCRNIAALATPTRARGVTGAESVSPP